MKKITEKYLQECDNAVHAADPRHEDVVITDLRNRINTLTNHIRQTEVNLIASKNSVSGSLEERLRNHYKDLLAKAAQYEMGDTENDLSTRELSLYRALKTLFRGY